MMSEMKQYYYEYFATHKFIDINSESKDKKKSKKSAKKTKVKKLVKDTQN